MTLVRTLLATIAGMTALAAPGASQAQTIDVPFDPPQIEASPNVCSPRPPDHVLAEQWADYDGGPFGDRDIVEIRRDLRLLRQADPVRWFDTIAAANARMLDVFDDYDDTNRVLDRVDLLVSAERFDQIAEENLIVEVLAAAESGSNSAIVSAADMFFHGRGVDRDVDRAISLYRRAAYGGHPSALLTLAELSTDREVDQWEIAPSVAVTMAFGALLGDLDPLICDRINRIAALYRTGEIVTRNGDLADEWYRLSASLGSNTAAWNVAQMHSDATLVEKDNEVMMAHLRQAAEGNLPYALLELGDILTRGALADRDLDAAQRSFEAAAETGDQTAKIRLVALARATADEGPEGRSRYAAALDRLLEAGNAPSWAYLQRGDLVLTEQGRWAGASTAADLYREARDKDPGNIILRLRLAELDLRDVGTEQALLETTADLRNAVLIQGQTDPMQDLQSLFRCRAPSAPILSQANYWADMEDYSGHTTADFNAEAIDQLDRDANPILYAKTQSQAVNSRARPLAALTYASATPDPFGAMRRMAANAGASIGLADAKIAFNRGDIENAERMSRAAIEAREPGADDVLIRVLLSRFDAGQQVVYEELTNLALIRAQTGNGDAIETLIAVGAIDTADAWTTYRDAIADNGDLNAMLFALPLIERDQIPILRERIRSIIDCNTISALAFADALLKAGERDTAMEWIDTAEMLLQGVGWEHVAIGDAILVHSPDLIDRAFAQYRVATEAGYPVAMRRILSLKQDKQVDLGAEETAEMFVQLVRSLSPEEVPQILQYMSYSDQDVRDIVEDRLDRRALYTEAAELGNPLAQLELARMVRELSVEGDTTEHYAELLMQAAEGGNPDAMLLLSQAYSYGIGLEADAGLSRSWLLAAADAGNKAAAATAGLLE